jgi:hypothetical protein
MIEALFFLSKVIDKVSGVCIGGFLIIAVHFGVRIALLVGQMGNFGLR